MGNIFHGGGRSLDLSNGGTDVFVDVLMLAVSDLADSTWEYRFATLLTLQDQCVLGRGVVGFDLEDIDWGRSPRERAAAKDFVLRVLDLALRRHRWDELGYEPPFAEGYLRQYREMVEAFDPAGAGRQCGDPPFPGPEEAAMASCVRHRVLCAPAYWEACVFCNASPRRPTVN
ncbi:hypothetical protein OG978_08555 [Streptomyces sp. NBC_01591]|uniref:hypothetical protein n=1 Tax=Streptomyces sp. NBC_01591 TaxID=2975888 RepID=UPI002DDC89A7|nr:hypothetical protein [Streptomyces sp. NBC_01591]WSD67434.1 hypothetical protein OG978_08555 [Streptomyces sp. NBC_01591]